MHKIMSIQECIDQESQQVFYKDKIFIEVRALENGEYETLIPSSLVS